MPRKTLFFILILMLLAFYVWQGIYLPKNRNIQENELFAVSKGEGLEEIALNLKSQEIIKSKLLFELYVFLTGKAPKLQAGKYELNPGLNIAQIAQKFVLGATIPPGIKVTIPEGFDVKQIDARLSEEGLIQPGEILAQSRLQQGYFFPDTYRFDEEAGLDGIIDKMKANFDKKLDQDLRNKIEAQGKTIEEIIIMASLIEREVATDEDRRIVSGIFWKRLANNYPLQSCATIAYILEVDKWRYSLEDTKIESPYNAYQHLGLPPSPICNPGLSAIKAAIEPQETDYNYFLSTPEGETIFSKTLKEHNIAKQKYLK